MVIIHLHFRPPDMLFSGIPTDKQTDFLSCQHHNLYCILNGFSKPNEIVSTIVGHSGDA
jgi:hypothetical protein